MKKKINKKKLSETGKLEGRACRKMREAAYGHDMQMHIYKTCDRSERMRDDDELLRKAQEKRDRKAAKALRSK